VPVIRIAAAQFSVSGDKADNPAVVLDPRRGLRSYVEIAARIV
jgi:hypothetical protein